MKPLKVLLVDDDPVLLETLKTELERQGHAVTTAGNGRDALRLATESRYDLVLLDVMIPYMDGYHVAREIGLRLAENAPKVILITARDTERERGVALMSGADAALQKPFDLDALRRVMAEVLPEDKENA